MRIEYFSIVFPQIKCIMSFQVYPRLISRVHFLKTNRGYPKDARVKNHPGKTWGVSSAIRPIRTISLHLVPIAGDLERGPSY